MKLFAFLFSVLFFGISETIEVASWTSTEFDFGQIQQNIPVDATYDLTNNGTTPLFIENVKVGCGCTSPNYSTDALQPGATTTISATYNAKKVGKFNKTVKVFTNLSDQPTTLRLKGEVIAK